MITAHMYSIRSQNFWCLEYTLYTDGLPFGGESWLKFLAPSVSLRRLPGGISYNRKAIETAVFVSTVQQVDSLC